MLCFRLYLVPDKISYCFSGYTLFPIIFHILLTVVISAALVMAGCGGQDGTPDHHPLVPRQHLQRGQQQLPQCQGDCRTRVSSAYT